MSDIIKAIVKANGAILARQKGVATVITLRTENAKIGPMSQVWALVDVNVDGAPVTPLEASRLGLDSLVCGQCPERHHLGGRCYVQLHQAPRSIVAKLNSASPYPVATAAQVLAAIADINTRAKNPIRGVRLGAYGDPAFMPAPVVAELAEGARAAGLTLTGYTHQWQSPAAAHLKTYCMASVDGPSESNAARADGWRYFRGAYADEPMTAGEFVCPTEVNEDMTCARCGACGGNPDGRKAKASPVIVWHGARAGSAK